MGLRLGKLTRELLPDATDLKEDDRKGLLELVLRYHSFVDSYISSTLCRGEDARKPKVENALVAAALASMAGLDRMPGSITYEEAQNKLSSILYNVQLLDDSTYGDTSDISVADVEFPLDETNNATSIDSGTKKDEKGPLSRKADKSTSGDNRSILTIQALSITSFAAFIVTYLVYTYYIRQDDGLHSR